MLLPQGEIDAVEKLFQSKTFGIFTAFTPIP